MSSQKTAFVGHCHCGNIELVFETGRALKDLPLRVCGCSFCVRHGGRYTSDPGGALRFTVQNPAHEVRYRFGMETADFLICGTCGVFLAAMTSADGSAYAVVNVNTFARAGLHPDADQDGLRRRGRSHAHGTPQGQLDAGRRIRGRPGLKPGIQGRGRRASTM